MGKSETIIEVEGDELVGIGSEVDVKAKAEDEVIADEPVSPTTDVMFKKLFAQKNSGKNLMGILNQVTQIPKSAFDKITIEDPHQQPDYRDDRLSIVDVKAQMKTGETILFEI